MSMVTSPSSSSTDTNPLQDGLMAVSDFMEKLPQNTSNNNNKNNNDDDYAKSPSTTTTTTTTIAPSFVHQEEHEYQVVLDEDEDGHDAYLDNKTTVQSLLTLAPIHHSFEEKTGVSQTVADLSANADADSWVSNDSNNNNNLNANLNFIEPVCTLDNPAMTTGQPVVDYLPLVRSNTQRRNSSKRRSKRRPVHKVTNESKMAGEATTPPTGWAQTGRSAKKKSNHRAFEVFMRLLRPNRRQRTSATSASSKKKSKASALSHRNSINRTNVLMASRNASSRKKRRHHATAMSSSHANSNQLETSIDCDPNDDGCVEANSAFSRASGVQLRKTHLNSSYAKATKPTSLLSSNHVSSSSGTKSNQKSKSRAFSMLNKPSSVFSSSSTASTTNSSPLFNYHKKRQSATPTNANYSLQSPSSLYYNAPYGASNYNFSMYSQASCYCNSSAAQSQPCALCSSSSSATSSKQAFRNSMNDAMMRSSSYSISSTLSKELTWYKIKELDHYYKVLGKFESFEHSRPYLFISSFLSFFLLPCCLVGWLDG